MRLSRSPPHVPEPRRRVARSARTPSSACPVDQLRHRSSFDGPRGPVTVVSARNATRSSRVLNFGRSSQGEPPRQRAIEGRGDTHDDGPPSTSAGTGGPSRDNCAPGDSAPSQFVRPSTARDRVSQSLEARPPSHPVLVVERESGGARACETEVVAQEDAAIPHTRARGAYPECRRTSRRRFCRGRGREHLCGLAAEHLPVCPVLRGLQEQLPRQLVRGPSENTSTPQAQPIGCRHLMAHFGWYCVTTAPIQAS